ncbi:MAG: hypothetical protein DRR19_14600, partial [Candidatus Parabeggiatoa sp. nov. 1]
GVKKYRPHFRTTTLSRPYKAIEVLKPWKFGSRLNFWAQKTDKSELGIGFEAKKIFCAYWDCLKIKA